MKIIRVFHRPTLILAIVMLSGCASIEVNNMVPDTSALTATRIDKTIVIANVKGAQDSKFGGPAMVSDEQFKSTLTKALQQSGIFRTVVTDGAADLEMSAEFVAQGQGAGLNYLSALVVEYIIVDSDTQEEVWSDAFNSRHKVTVGEAFSGDKRTVRAAEGSVRKNIAQLLDSLAEAGLD